VPIHVRIIKKFAYATYVYLFEIIGELDQTIWGAGIGNQQQNL